MPFTPFHFGPGTLAKAAFPGQFSLTAFVASQVLIDVEPLWYMLRGDWPIHRQLHTLPVAAAVGVAAGLVVGLLATFRAR